MKMFFLLSLFLSIPQVFAQFESSSISGAEATANNYIEGGVKVVQTSKCYEVKANDLKDICKEDSENLTTFVHGRDGTTFALDFALVVPYVEKGIIASQNGRNSKYTKKSSETFSLMDYILKAPKEERTKFFVYSGNNWISLDVARAYCKKIQMEVKSQICKK